MTHGVKNGKLRHDGCKLCEMFAEQRPPGGAAPSTWGTAAPIHSEAMAVHPDQIPAVMERNKKHGLGHIRYDRHGAPILTDRAMRRDLMRLEGLHDRSGGYGDDHATASPQAPLTEEQTGGPMADIGQHALERANPHVDVTAEA